MERGTESQTAIKDRLFFHEIPETLPTASFDRVS